MFFTSETNRRVRLRPPIVRRIATTTLSVRPVCNAHSRIPPWEPTSGIVSFPFTIKCRGPESRNKQRRSEFYAQKARRLRAEPAVSLAWRGGANVPGKREPAMTQQDKSDLVAME